MASVASGPGWPLHLFGRVMLGPPVCAVAHIVAAKYSGLDIPLHRENEIVVADLGKVSLLPFAAVGEGDIFLFESDERIGLGKIAEDRLWFCLDVLKDIRH